MPIVTIGENTGDSFAGVEDTFIDSAAPTSNLSGNSDVSVSKYDASAHGNGIFRFPGLSNISGPVTVNEVRLYGAIEFLSISAGYEISARRLLRNTNIAQTTWNIYSTGNNWATAGGLSNGTDRVTTVSGVWTAAGTEAGGQYVYLTGSGMAQDVADWINGVNSNYGWHLERTDGQDDEEFFGFTSSEGGDTTRPYLYIDYTAGGGGTVNTESLDDSISTSDSALTSMLRGVVSSDSLLTSDGAALFYRRMRELTSDVIITEGATDRFITSNLEATSEISVADSAVLWLRRNRLLDDSILVTDELISSIIGYLIYIGTLTSSVSVTDEALKSTYFQRLLDSNVVTTDQALRALLVARDLLDSVAVTDSGLTAMQRFILLTDTLMVEDSLVAMYVPEVGPVTDNPIIRIGFDQPEIALGGYGLN